LAYTLNRIYNRRKAMSVTVADCLNLPSLRQGKVIAGAKGLGNPVNNISVIEITNPKFLISDKSINNCEISITSLYSVKDDIAAQCRVIEHLHNIGDVGMIIYYVGIVVKQIDKRLIELADSLDFPIIVMPENRDDFRYDEAIFEVTEALSRDRMVEHDISNIIALSASRLPEYKHSMASLLRIISDTLRISLILTDDTFTSIISAPWPISNALDCEYLISGYRSLARAKEEIISIETGGNTFKVVSMDFSAVEFRHYSMYFADEFGNFTLQDAHQAMEIIQLLSKVWNLDEGSSIENSLIAAILDADDARMIRLAEKYRVDVAAINTMFIIRPGYAEESFARQLEIRSSFLSGIKSEITKDRSVLLADSFEDYIVVFTHFRDIINIKDDYLSNLCSCLDAINYPYTISFFPNDYSVNDVRKTFLLYNQCCEDMLTIYPGKKLFSYSDLLFAERCRGILDSDSDEKRIIRNILTPLENCSDSEELLTTLAIFHLDANCEIKTTAERLFLHRNTIQYRLNKIGDITNYHNSDTVDTYLMHTAIACYRLNKEAPSK
jgi:Purine catabolism regulatory protein-like family.